MPSIRSIILLLVAVVLSGSAGAAQVSAPPTTKTKPIHVHSVTVKATGDETAIEIDASGPLTPRIGKIENPRQIVIDLPNAAISDHPKPIDFHSDAVAAIHLAQLPTQPPLTRIIVDLRQALAYDWDSSHNRLRIHLRAQTATAAPEPVSASVPNAVLVNGTRLMAGSSVTAADHAMELKLGRGGNIRVCPGTTVSVTPSRNGDDLLLGMNTGAIETNYSLAASADSILTPDFRILLAGPGDFHFAISADSHGNTCVRSLAGNTASAIVTELVGDGSYQVKPSEEVVFHAGQLRQIDSRVPEDCGCPVPGLVNVASAAASQPAAARGNSELGNAASGMPAKIAASQPETAAVPEIKPGDVHVQVDAPLVFHAAKPVPVLETPTREVQNLPAGIKAPVSPIPNMALPPATAEAANAGAQTSAPHRSLLGRIKGFFGRLFS